MVEEGKAYSVVVPDGAGWFTGYQRGDVVIDFLCSRIVDNTAHFDPIKYAEDEIPEGRTLGTQSFSLPVDEVSTKDFNENVELTRKIQLAKSSSN